MNDCIRYFKKYAVYSKLFTGFREKYESLGHFGGTVTLTGLSPGETSDLFGFFNKDYTGKKKVVVTARQMEKALAQSRFSEYSWEEILTAYFGETLTVKKEQRQKIEEQRENWFMGLYREIYAAFPASIAEWFLDLYQNKREGYLFFVQRYKEEAQEDPTCFRLKNRIFTICHCMEHLPLELPEPINVFAARMTGNPHFLDSGTDGERLILLYLKYIAINFGKDDILKDANVDGEGSSTDDTGLEQKTKCLYKAGLLKDELSNDVLVYGIHGKLEDGRYHQGIEGFTKEKEAVKLTLGTVEKLDSVIPAAERCMNEAEESMDENSEADGQYKEHIAVASVKNRQNNVYIVENPAVFSYLIRKYPDITAICGNGQIRLAALYLLDRFPAACHFYYAGDFDPEGLLIAQRLKRRYQERLEFWNYDTSIYMDNLSDVMLDEIRLKKMEGITIPELQPLCEAIRKEGRAAYQECMMERYSVFE